MSHANSTIVIAGGSGFLGISLASHLAERRIPVVIVSRTPPKAAGAWRHVAWDARAVGDWAGALDGARAVVNLAGRSVDCVKTPEHQDEILRSRVESTRTLAAAMRTIANPPPIWVQMSTAHIYGDPPSAVCTEDSALGFGLLHLSAGPGRRPSKRAGCPDSAASRSGRALSSAGTAARARERSDGCAGWRGSGSAGLSEPGARESVGFTNST